MIVWHNVGGAVVSFLVSWNHIAMKQSVLTQSELYYSRGQKYFPFYRKRHMLNVNLSFYYQEFNENLHIN